MCGDFGQFDEYVTCPVRQRSRDRCQQASFIERDSNLVVREAGERQTRLKSEGGIPNSDRVNSNILGFAFTKDFNIQKVFWKVVSARSLLRVLYFVSANFVALNSRARAKA
ncbi:hypothetical protein CK227_34465 [Mesorhizobium sp. WSM4308]|nr:hypothetical protein CK232_34075 [Mesorhizobium sp. WSM4304]PBB70971.1 hypothetical protein CK227_34465 [Mesorhizobium sp. WSM4308]